jgi:hypothetical protein
VPDVIHHNPKSKRTAVTLFAGNLDFKVRDKDILESLRTHFKRRIHVDVIDVPNFNGRHKGYAVPSSRFHGLEMHLWTQLTSANSTLA